MLRRTLLAIGMMAMVFSAHADLMTYTFSGDITWQILDGAVSNEVVPVSYSFLIDYDEPGMYEGSPKNDYTNTTTPWQTTVYDYASVTFGVASNYYYENKVVTQGAVLACTQDQDYYGTHSLYSEILLYGYGSSGLISNFMRIQGAGSFEVGGTYTLIDRLNDYSEDNFPVAKGSVTLMSITAYNPPEASVPEPGTITLMASSLLMLSGLGFRRKKS